MGVNLRKEARGRPCMVEGCDKPVKAHSWCQMHYFRARRSGDAETEPYAVWRERALHRFMESWEQVTETGCWIWLGAINTNTGYGKFNRDNRSISAHRASYEYFKGEIPEGRHVLHSCDVRCCVNPAHLRLGGHEDNMRDRQVRDRAGKKLAIADVRAIREDPRSTRAIGADYDVSSATVSEIKRGRIWQHV